LLSLCAEHTQDADMRLRLLRGSEAFMRQAELYGESVGSLLRRDTNALAPLFEIACLEHELGQLLAEIGEVTTP
jgi:hypothetical protein